MLNDSVLLSLQRATHATLHQIAAELVDLDLLTASEINALGNLADGQARTVSELGALVGSRPATLTGVLDRLERRGLISRGALPGDRRAVRITLTAAGQSAATAVRTKLTEIEQRALAGLDDAAMAGFHQVINALMAGARR